MSAPLTVAQAREEFIEDRMHHLCAHVCANCFANALFICVVHVQTYVIYSQGLRRIFNVSSPLHVRAKQHDRWDRDYWLPGDPMQVNRLHDQWNDLMLFSTCVVFIEVFRVADGVILNRNWVRQMGGRLYHGLRSVPRPEPS